jgi:hypothetical protein
MEIIMDKEITITDAINIAESYVNEDIGNIEEL